jgi:3-dehydroquinate synthetase
MVAEARLAEKLGLAETGLAATIDRILKSIGLPTSIPAGIDCSLILQTMNLDKKRTAKRVMFALPVRVGEVKTGCEVDDIEGFLLTG